MYSKLRVVYVNASVTGRAQLFLEKKGPEADG